jgi:hypothetical protein
VGNSIITNQLRDQVRAAHKRGLGRNAIAEEVGVSTGSVTSICKAAGLTFDRSITKSATEAKQEDDKTIRASIASNSLSLAKQAAAILAERLITNPDEVATRELTTIFGVFIDKYAVLAKLDENADTELTDSVVDKLLAGFKESADG